jgi:hypothetical protein
MICSFVKRERHREPTCTVDYLNDPLVPHLDYLNDPLVPHLPDLSAAIAQKVEEKDSWGEPFKQTYRYTPFTMEVHWHSSLATSFHVSYFSRVHRHFGSKEFQPVRHEYDDASTRSTCSVFLWRPMHNQLHRLVKKKTSCSLSRCLVFDMFLHAQVNGTSCFAVPSPLQTKNRLEDICGAHSTCSHAQPHVSMLCADHTVVLLGPRGRARASGRHRSPQRGHETWL